MQEKTEQPTPKKLRDAREKGQVVQSKEVVSCAMMIGIFGYFFALGDIWSETIAALINLPANLYQLPFHQALQIALIGAGKLSLLLLGTLFAVTAVIGVFSNIMQFGPLFSLHPVKPEMKKINPLEGAKKIFCLKNLVEFIKSVVKISLLSILIYWVIRGNLLSLLRLPDCGLDCIKPFLSHLLAQLAIVTSLAFLLVAVGDYFFQRFNHTKQLKMTKDEVKREFKDTDGDPDIKGKRKQIHRELLQGGMLSDVKRSSVLVCNPSHYAIGIYYDYAASANQHTARLPIITLKAKGLTARRYKELAGEQDIPLIENVPLARGLYAEAEVDRAIPSEFIQPVAEVLKWVEKLQRLQQ